MEKAPEPRLNPLNFALPLLQHSNPLTSGFTSNLAYIRSARAAQTDLVSPAYPADKEQYRKMVSSSGALLSGSTRPQASASSLNPEKSSLITADRNSLASSVQRQDMTNSSASSAVLNSSY